MFHRSIGGRDISSHPMLDQKSRADWACLAMVASAPAMTTELILNGNELEKMLDLTTPIREAPPLLQGRESGNSRHGFDGRREAAGGLA